jgi:hypothetical protein
MNQTARRPLPHIQHTAELEAAAIAVTNAKCCLCPGGLPVNLVDNPFDVAQVREALANVSKWFEDPSFFMNDLPPHSHTPQDAELAAAVNLQLLSKLLSEHLKAGNT